MTSSAGARCKNDARSDGLCLSHQTRIARWGHVGRDIPLRAYVRVAPVAAARYLEGNTDEERFFSAVTKTTDHWLWNGGVCKANGLGQLGYGGYNQTAGRVSWLITYGPLPKGARVSPTCGERLCVRPSHLRAVYRNGTPVPASAARSPKELMSQ
ncbi:HNH endonuclease [Streptomyces sp. NPDC047097]|uniref:HNH endonuclease n=1 Tax=Streptomyces sp. NPDC047097 TaxID=3155260 RepID=UPI0033E153BA